jgi:hypothetical protein
VAVVSKLGLLRAAAGRASTQRGARTGTPPTDEHPHRGRTILVNQRTCEDPKGDLGPLYSSDQGP